MCILKTHDGCADDIVVAVLITSCSWLIIVILMGWKYYILRQDYLQMHLSYTAAMNEANNNNNNNNINKKNNNKHIILNQLSPMSEEGAHLEINKIRDNPNSSLQYNDTPTPDNDGSFNYQTSNTHTNTNTNTNTKTNSISNCDNIDQLQNERMNEMNEMNAMNKKNGKNIINNRFDEKEIEICKCNLNQQHSDGSLGNLYQIMGCCTVNNGQRNDQFPTILRQVSEQSALGAVAAFVDKNGQIIIKDDINMYNDQSIDTNHTIDTIDTIEHGTSKQERLFNQFLYNGHNNNNNTNNNGENSEMSQFSMTHTCDENFGDSTIILFDGPSNINYNNFHRNSNLSTNKKYLDTDNNNNNNNNNNNSIWDMQSPTFTNTLIIHQITESGLTNVEMDYNNDNNDNKESSVVVDDIDDIVLIENENEIETSPKHLTRKEKTQRQRQVQGNKKPLHRSNLSLKATQTENQSNNKKNNNNNNNNNNQLPKFNKSQSEKNPRNKLSIN